MQIQCQSSHSLKLNRKLNTEGDKSYHEACFVIGVFSDGTLTPLGEKIHRFSHENLKPLISNHFLSQPCGTWLYFPFMPNFSGKLLLVHCSEASEALSVFAYQTLLDRIGSALITLMASHPFRFIYFELTCLSVKKKSSAFTFFEAGHRINQFFYDHDLLALKTTQSFKTKRPVLQLLGDHPFHPNITVQLNALTTGLKLVRDLANLPANICTPRYLAEEARKISRSFPKKLSLTVFGKTALKKMGMRTLLAVSQGSAQEPQFICLHYKGAQKKQKPVVFIGKGITFDSGGLCLKPPPAMDEMKYDMCGAATVLGLIQTVATLQLNLNIIGLVPAAENVIDAKATRPGDIIKSFSGKTIEILNTDAEGRLILCDALSYAEKFSPQAVIDIATLTGGALMTFGPITHALMGNNNDLIQALLNASENCGERSWELPLWEEYQAMLKSRFADLPNIHDSAYAKTIIAGCFLSRFAENYPWAHLDIAGTAWIGGKNKGATGRPLLLLLTYLEAIHEKNRHNA